MVAAVSTHRYEPRGMALELFSAREPELLVCGPVGTGKTRACLEKVHLMCLLNPGMRALIIRKTAVSLTSTVLVTFKEHVAAEALRVGDVIWYGGSSQESAQYRYSNGSVIVVGGLDKSSRIMSSEYDIVFVPEATEVTEEEWEHIKTRLRNGKVSFQQVIGDCNPSHPSHWLKSRCDKGQTKILNTTLKENPRFFDGSGEMTSQGKSYIENLKGLTGVRKLRLIDNVWAAAEGMIYEEEWDENIHLINKRLPRPEWPRYWSIDFGFTHPFVLQCWAEDPDGRLILYREIFHTRKTVDEHCADILRIVAPSGNWREPKPVWVVCDHDAEGRATFTKETGLKTVAAKKQVKEGIQAVKRRLRPRDDGTPGILFQRDVVIKRDMALANRHMPTCTVDEFGGYVWDLQAASGDPKETPVKEFDDGMDATRYLVMAKDYRRTPGVRYVS
jgi:phage terminase large subunit